MRYISKFWRVMQNRFLCCICFLGSPKAVGRTWVNDAEGGYGLASATWDTHYVKFTDCLGSCAKDDIKTYTIFCLCFGLLKETKINGLFKKTQIELIFVNWYLWLYHITLHCEKLSSDTKKSLIKFERISNKDFYHIDLLCWERPPQANRSIVGFNAGLHLVWVHPDMGKGRVWGVWWAGQQLCCKALGRQHTEHK